MVRNLHDMRVVRAAIVVGIGAFLCRVCQEICVLHVFVIGE